PRAADRGLENPHRGQSAGLRQAVRQPLGDGAAPGPAPAPTLVAPPRFSILTPVYETPAGVLRKTLRSVLRQTWEDWELCLVDDGSSEPHVREILSALAAADPRVRVELRAENAGIVPTSNDALAMAEGEFVALLDHDDTLHPEALACVAAAIDANP